MKWPPSAPSRKLSSCGTARRASRAATDSCSSRTRRVRARVRVGRVVGFGPAGAPACCVLHWARLRGVGWADSRDPRQNRAQLIQQHASTHPPTLPPTADMKRAYKRADGLKLDGRRILVDVERGRCGSLCLWVGAWAGARAASLRAVVTGQCAVHPISTPTILFFPHERTPNTSLPNALTRRRTVRGWRPRRLGGGLGDTRRDKVAKRKTKQATWVNPPIGASQYGLRTPPTRFAWVT